MLQVRGRTKYGDDDSTVIEADNIVNIDEGKSPTLKSQKTLRSLSSFRDLRGLRRRREKVLIRRRAVTAVPEDPWNTEAHRDAVFTSTCVASDVSA